MDLPVQFAQIYSSDLPERFPMFIEIHAIHAADDLLTITGVVKHTLINEIMAGFAASK